MTSNRNPENASGFVVENLSVRYATSYGQVLAASNVSFRLAPGEAIGLWGRSGCGKSSLITTLLGLSPGLPGWVNGTVYFEGTRVSPEVSSYVFDDRRRGIWKDVIGFQRTHNRLIQPYLGESWRTMFQEPVYGFEPGRDMAQQALEIADHLADQDNLPRSELRAELEASLERLGLSVAKISGKKNIQLSGGECQRVALALSVIGKPKLLLADEPLTAMDPRMRQPAIKLLREKVDQGMMLVLASHNLAEMRALVDRLLVIYEGEIIEDIPNDRTGQSDPGYRHPHTQNLSASPGAAALPGRAAHHEGAEVQGCPYRSECRIPLERPSLDEQCRTQKPPLDAIGPNHHVACWFVHESEAADSSAESSS